MSTATREQIVALAATVEAQAQAIATGRVIGPLYAAVRRMQNNVETLAAWTANV